jgi:hypothetical protein
MEYIYSTGNAVKPSTHAAINLKVRVEEPFRFGTLCDPGALAREAPRPGRCHA